MVLMASLLHMEAPEPEMPGRLQAVGAGGELELYVIRA